MLDFLYTAVSWVLLRWHQLFTAIGIDKDSGLNWTLSIVFLVITALVLLFRLFIRQVHYQRHMAEMQPKIQALREKYKNDKAEQQRQMMKLQQEEGFNPLSGCLPMFLQIPVFIGLLHVLRHLAAAASPTYQTEHATDGRLTLYGFTKEQTISAAQAKIFGHAPLAGEFRDTAEQIATLGGKQLETRLIILVVVLISATATFTTQLLSRRMQTTEPVGTAATMQRLMLWAIPLFTLGSGLFFPLGVLIYWLVSNSWTAGQQAYIMKFHPNTPKETAPVGEVGRALAPKPGAKPQRQQGRAKPVAPSPEDGVSLDKSGSGGGSPDGSAGTGARAKGDAAGASTSAGSGPAPISAPRPGQKPKPGSRPATRQNPKSKKRR